MKPEDIEDLKQLIEFLKENQVAEFDLDRGDVKIRLKFNSAVAPAVVHALGNLPIMATPALPSAGPPPGAPAAPPPAEPEEELHTVKSPIVGTYYGSPSPGSAPFVSPGDHVDKGQVICIVEAMKLMNEIEAEFAGTIVECLAETGNPVEFGQKLFKVKKA